MHDAANSADSSILPAHEQAHARFSQHADARSTAWLQPLRERALQTFATKGFPSTRDEDWKYTNLTRVAERNAACLGQEPVIADKAVIADRLTRLPKLTNCYSVVFANGRFQSDLSRLPGKDAGVTIQIFSHADEDTRNRILDRLGHGGQSAAFRLGDLNTAFLTDGIIVTVQADVSVTSPIHAVFLADGPAIVTQPRILVNLGQNSRATFIEQYLDGGAGVTNAITEIDCAKSAHLTYYKLQEQSDDVYHLAAQAINMAKDSHVKSLHLDLGGGLARNDLLVKLTGAGSSAELFGLFLVDGERHVDNHTRVDHLAEKTMSRENYRGVIDDRGRGIFNGKIIVHPGADQTDAKLNNRNLVLSRTGEVDTKPELEIYTDDVKCSHGATTGQLDDNAIFYLQSRGIPAAQARQILIAAFAREVLSHVEVEALAEHIESAVAAKLPD